MGWLGDLRRARVRFTLTTAAIAAALTVAGCAGSPAPGEGPIANRDTRAPNTEVLGATATRSPIVVTPYERQAFLEIALRSASATPERAPVLSRWTRPPTVALRGHPTAEDVRQVVAATQQWGVAIGLPVSVGAAPADIDVAFVPRAEFGAKLSADRVDADAVGLTRVRYASGRRGELAGASVVIASDDHQVSRNRTIAHEFGHALGLQHSTCASSLMDGSGSSERSVRWKLSPFDVRMAGLVYDTRLAAGLSLDAVDDRLDATAVVGTTCAPVDLELIRAAGSGRQFFCERSAEPVRPCTANLWREPALPIADPDAWTDGTALSAQRPR